eukprot:m.88168 g.88168  ORF g.88168 m.88168 type:complete len:495 (+) comp15168_c0_seq2:3-1487(+)
MHKDGFTAWLRRPVPRRHAAGCCPSLSVSSHRGLLALVVCLVMVWALHTVMYWGNTRARSLDRLAVSGVEARYAHFCPREPWQDSYAQLHARVVHLMETRCEETLAADPSFPPIVVVTCEAKHCSGFGDRVSMALANLLMSIGTNRALFLNHTGPNFADYFDPAAEPAAGGEEGSEAEADDDVFSAAAGRAQARQKSLPSIAWTISAGVQRCVALAQKTHPERFLDHQWPLLEELQTGRSRLQQLFTYYLWPIDFHRAEQQELGGSQGTSSTRPALMVTNMDNEQYFNLRRIFMHLPAMLSPLGMWYPDPLVNETPDLHIFRGCFFHYLFRRIKPAFIHDAGLQPYINTLRSKPSVGLQVRFGDKHMATTSHDPKDARLPHTKDGVKSLVCRILKAKPEVEAIYLASDSLDAMAWAKQSLAELGRPAVEVLSYPGRPLHVVDPDFATAGQLKLLADFVLLGETTLLVAGSKSGIERYASARTFIPKINDEAARC